jgi:hypothetical protein
VSEEQVPSEESKVIEPPDVSKDTEAVKELYAMLSKIQVMYTVMSPEEQKRMDEISEYFFGV